MAMMNDKLEGLERIACNQAEHILSEKVVGVVDQLDNFCSTERKLSHQSVEVDWASFTEKVQRCLVQNQKGEWEFQPLKGMLSITIGRHPELQKMMQGSQVNLKLYKAKSIPTKNAAEARDKLRLIFGVDRKQGNIVYLELYYKEKDSDDCHGEIVAESLLSYPAYLETVKEHVSQHVSTKQESARGLLAIERTKDDILLHVMDMLNHRSMDELGMLEHALEEEGNADLLSIFPFETVQKEQGKTETTIVDSHQSNDVYQMWKKKYQQQKQENDCLKKEVDMYKNRYEEVLTSCKNVEAELAEQAKQLSRRTANEKKVKEAHKLIRSPILKGMHSLKLTDAEEQIVASMLSYVVLKIRSGEITFSKSLVKEVLLQCKMFFLDVLQSTRKLWR